MKWIDKQPNRGEAGHHRHAQCPMFNVQCLALCLMLLLSGCQSLEQISIDYMQPAKISFPETLKRVGIVNNVPNDLPNRLSSRYTDRPDVETSVLLRKTSYYNGLPEVTTEALAHAIADENYFEQVIICDSALRAGDSRIRTGGLTAEEVRRLAADLGVDMLVSLESVQLRSVLEAGYYPEFGFFVGAQSVNVHPTVKLYLPTEESPIALINVADSIYWEEAGGSLNYVQNHLISHQEMLRQASDYAGTLPVKSLLPYWDSTQRYYFTSGSVKMRDGTVYAREGNWAEAARLWREAYDGTKSTKKQFYAALNLALAYEMQDNMKAAYQWAQTAASKAQGDYFPMLALNYQAALKKRLDDKPLLDAQLSRFNQE